MALLSAAALCITSYAVAYTHQGFADELSVAVVVVIFVFSIYGYVHDWRRAEITLQIRLQRDKQIMQEVRDRRWLVDADRHDENFVMLDQLAVIPAVRFAYLAGKDLTFLAVAGTRVVLVALLRWQPGRYTLQQENEENVIYLDGKRFTEGTQQLKRIITDAGYWEKVLRSTRCRTIVVVLASSSSPQGRVVVQCDGDGQIDFTTPGRFADYAGSFLATDAYEFNLPILKHLLLDPDSPLAKTSRSLEKFGAIKPR